VPEVPADPYADDEIPPALPAATVVPLRDGPDGLETVLLRRDRGLTFAGGLWVWPGGRIEDADGPRVGPDPLGALEESARRAAAREAVEEAGIMVDPADMAWFAHFTPPLGAERRYATFFFAAPVDAHLDVRPDGHEVHEHRWFTPRAALAACTAGDIGLSPPTWIVLEWLAAHRDTASAMAHFDQCEPEWCVTRFARVEGGMVAMYHGDAGYHTDDPDAPGGRHRLWILESGWRYERDATSGATPEVGAPDPGGAAGEG
jgi:8-oxo-dGTP pyrophosphatase MutT (NUDIX family)